MNIRTLTFIGVLASGSIGATAHAAIIVSPYAEISANAQINVPTTGTSINVSDLNSKSGPIPFGTTKASEASGTAGTTSAQSASDIQAQFSWTKPDEDHFFLEVNGTGSARATSTCSTNCSGLQLTAEADAYSSLTFTIDSPYRYTMSFDMNDSLADASGSPSVLFISAASARVSIHGPTPDVVGIFNETDTYIGTAYPGEPSFMHSDVLLPGTYTFEGTLAAYVFQPYYWDGSATALADFTGKFNFSLTPVPLPAAAWLLISGLGGVAAFARRRRVGKSVAA